MKPSWLSKWPTGQQLTLQNPFAKSEFITSLEASNVCGKDNGWVPHHYSDSQSSNILIPAYLKSNSWGEYVFDFAWASAYQEHGLAYYPKLVFAIPFTPSQGPRLPGIETNEQVLEFIENTKEHCAETGISGFHILFANGNEQSLLNDTELHKRSDVQFHWKNQDYRDFDDFLDRFSSRKRKNLRKERKSITDQMIEMRTLEGDQIDDNSWNHFYQFYHATYLKRGRQGYLNKEFFDQVKNRLKQNLVLFMAYKDSQPIAGALCFKDEKRLYGRYWGCFEEFNNLHFEACYYQGIEYCIANNLESFDPGTQGEHKIARGFEPIFTHSYHWLTHPDFNNAVKGFCAEEKKMTTQYHQQTYLALPFKQLKEETK